MMKAHNILKKLKHTDRELAADMLLALAVGAVFIAFAVTVMQMDDMAANRAIYFPGRIVYM